MGPIHDLTDMLSKLPGLGPRQARRVVQYLLARDQTFRHSLAGLIDSMSAKTARCAKCLRYDDPNAGGLCITCADMTRDHTTLVVIEHDVDIDALEASLTYKGYYFVLGGLMPLAKQKKVPVIHDRELVQSIKERITEGLTEVIFALSTTPEGDFTTRELEKELGQKYPSLKMTLLGRGLSVGAELEYADPETLRNALKSRT